MFHYVKVEKSELFFLFKLDLKYKNSEDRKTREGFSGILARSSSDLWKSTSRGISQNNTSSECLIEHGTKGRNGNGNGLVGYECHENMNDRDPGRKAQATAPFIIFPIYT